MNAKRHAAGYLMICRRFALATLRKCLSRKRKAKKRQRVDCQCLTKKTRISFSYPLQSRYGLHYGSIEGRKTENIDRGM